MLSVFIFPQLLGVLLYLRLSRAPRWLAVTASTLVPTLVWVFLAPIFLFAGVREAQTAGAVTCGMPAYGALLLLFAGTIMQVFISLIVQVLLLQRRRRTVI